jgi:hypothetical protein
VVNKGRNPARRRAQLANRSYPDRLPADLRRRSSTCGSVVKSPDLAGGAISELSARNPDISCALEAEITPARRRTRPARSSGDDEPRAPSY